MYIHIYIYYFYVYASVHIHHNVLSALEHLGNTSYCFFCVLKAQVAMKPLE